MRYLVNVTYDGSKFYGYQIQKDKITVEGEIQKNLTKILNKNIKIVSASRTDKAVHAINQYFHFDYDKDLDIKKIIKSFNSLINPSIYIKNIQKIDENMHARYSVIKKEYIYKINLGEYNPLEKDYVLQYNKRISKELLKSFCDIISGKHNFKSFTSDKDKYSYERDIKVSYKIQNKILYLKFESTGFLRYMIRNIVGLLIDINENKKSINDIDYIFKSQNRSTCGKCASSVGLYLHKILYY